MSARGRRTVLAVAVLVLLGLVALAVPALRGIGNDPDGTGTAAAHDDASAPTAERCDVDGDHPGPLLDLGVNTDTGDAADPSLSTAEVRRLVGVAARAGADVVSTTVSWRTVQPRRGATPDWTGLDRVLDAAEARDLQVRVRLIHTPAWALDAASRRATDGSMWTPPRTDAELDRWKAFVEDVLTHLDGRAAYVETWSEPDNADRWATGPNAAAFGALLRATAAARDAVGDSTTMLVSGGLDGNDIGFAQELVDYLGGTSLLPFDLVGVDPYTDLDPAAAPGEPGDDGRLDAFAGYQQVADVTGTGVYVSEVGWSTDDVSRATRATYATTVLEVATCTTDVEALSWYHLHVTPYDPAAYALLTADGRIGPTYAALRAWTETRAAVGATSRDGSS
ncbi:MAG: hypothetical protein CMH83_02055 [Nocardioides sp.]|nr:hypothetical protein [Nocardioides sp.]